MGKCSQFQSCCARTVCAQQKLRRPGFFSTVCVRKTWKHFVFFSNTLLQTNSSTCASGLLSKENDCLFSPNSTLPMFDGVAEQISTSFQLRLSLNRIMNVWLPSLCFRGEWPTEGTKKYSANRVRMIVITYLLTLLNPFNFMRSWTCNCYVWSIGP